MRLNKAELRLLRTIRGETTLQALEQKLEISPSYASTLISSLQEKNLVRKERQKRQIHLKPSDTKAIELLHQLSDTYSHINWEELLAGKAIEILFYLDTAHSVSDLETLSDNYRNTIYRILRRFQERGIIRKEGKQYTLNTTLNDDFTRLAEFAREYVHHTHRNTIRSVSAEATIIWESVHEFLIQTSETIEEDNFIQTGPTRFQDFGIELLSTSKNYYLYTEDDDTLTPADLICHTLLIDDGPRYQTYCLLLMRKQDVAEGELLAAAQQYSVEERVKHLLDYLETQGEIEEQQLPSWDSFQTTAHEYGVTT